MLQMILGFYIQILIYMENHPKCINRCPAITVCVDKTCPKANPFLCGGVCANKKCEGQHKKCMTIKWIIYKRKLEEKKKMNDIQFTNICKLIQEMLASLHKTIQIQRQYYIDWKNNYGVPTKVIELYKAIEQNKQEQLFGKDLDCLIDNIRSQKDSYEKKQIQQIASQIDQILHLSQHMTQLIRKLMLPREKQNILKANNLHLFPKPDLKKSKNIQNSQQQPFQIEITENSLQKVYQRITHIPKSHQLSFLQLQYQIFLSNGINLKKNQDLSTLSQFFLIIFIEYSRLFYIYRVHNIFQSRSNQLIFISQSKIQINKSVRNLIKIFKNTIIRLELIINSDFQLINKLKTFLFEEDITFPKLTDFVIQAGRAKEIRLPLDDLGTKFQCIIGVQKNLIELQQ